MKRLICAIRGHRLDLTVVFLAAPPRPTDPRIVFVGVPFKLRECQRCGDFAEVVARK